MDAKLFWKNQPKMKIKKRNQGKMIRSNWHTYFCIIDKYLLGDSFHYACSLQDTRIISSCIHLNLLPIFCITIKIYKKIWSHNNLPCFFIHCFRVQHGRIPVLLNPNMLFFLENAWSSALSTHLAKTILFAFM